MKTKMLIFFAVMMFSTSLIQAQDYKSAIGAKLGYGLIASYKTFLNEKAALDIFGGIRWGGLAAGAYYLNHTPIKSVDRLTWYWGFGGSFTTWDYGIAGLDNYYEIGVSGVLGLDYSFDNIPLNLSVDWAPTIVVADSYDYAGASLSRFRSGYGALTARYILNGSSR
ncbi:MAG: hypothetical protein IPL08_06370 [Saprospiraceae bacterium]|nr:hypothetical protein [Saprospiraceae bacterium]MBK8670221.1 hypothetical protein [Saprospiraceae bacterium]MBL0099894.1 hypothetical protein [Saprospiraceae bacterium]